MRGNREIDRSWTISGSEQSDFLKDFRRSASPGGARHQFVTSTVETLETEAQRVDLRGSLVVSGHEIKRSTLPPKKFLAESDFLSDSGVLSDDSGDEKKQKNLNFQPDSKWKNSKSCYVCKRVFDQLQGIFRHHCRLCANSACGECSLKRVQNKRICDVCDLKKNEAKKEEMRNNCLTHMDSQIQTRKEKNKLLTQQVEDEEIRVNKFSEEATKDEQHLSKSLQISEDDCTKSHTMLKKLKEMNERSKKVLEVKLQEITEKKKEYTNTSSKVKQLNLEIMNKKTALLIKIEEFAKRQEISDNLKRLKRFDRSESLVSTQALYPHEDFITREERSGTFSGYTMMNSTYDHRKPSFIKEANEGYQTNSFIGAVGTKKSGLCGW